jgi:hypothetical protein
MERTKMNKLFIGLFCVALIFTQSSYYGSTTAPVTLAGGIIKAKHVQDSVSKYKRKDCPVCKGKGWYMSGDGILKIDCTYCEEDKGSLSIGTIKSVTPIVPVPKTYSAPINCPDGNCPINKTPRR